MDCILIGCTFNEIRIEVRKFETPKQQAGLEIFLLVTFQFLKH